MYCVALDGEINFKEYDKFREMAHHHKFLNIEFKSFVILCATSLSVVENEDPC